MHNINWATPLYKFLRLCNQSELEKVILDCGAGGDKPPLEIFYDYGYQTFGVELAPNPLEEVRGFCEESGKDLNVVHGDMRHIPMGDESVSFVYSYNAIIFMTKADIQKALKEMDLDLQPYPRRPEIHDPLCRTLRRRCLAIHPKTGRQRPQIRRPALPPHILAPGHRTDPRLFYVAWRHPGRLCLLRVHHLPLPETQTRNPAYTRMRPHHHSHTDYDHVILFHVPMVLVR